MVIQKREKIDKKKLANGYVICSDSVRSNGFYIFLFLLSTFFSIKKIHGVLSTFEIVVSLLCVKLTKSGLGKQAMENTTLESKCMLCVTAIRFACRDEQSRARVCMCMCVILAQKKTFFFLVSCVPLFFRLTI